MFELGFPPVPTSIVNVDVDKRYAKDVSQPFSLLEFIKIVSNIVDTNNITSYYNHYITLWNTNKNKQSSTSANLIVEGYRNFIKDLTLNYNSQAENKFLSQIDYSDPYDLDVALKFIADKIQSIALYYRDKREDVKLESTRKKYKASTKGLVISIKEKIIEFLLNNNNKTISGNVDEISKNLNVSVDPLYDGEAEYFNKVPDSKTYGANDRDYNEDIFLKSNNELVTEIFAGLSTNLSNLREVDDLFTNKRDLTKKYMGTDFYYISATPVLSSAPVLNVQSDFNIRYNKDFIRLLTTTLPVTGIIETTIPLSPTTKKPTNELGTTTPAPINTPSFGFGDRKYDCVNGTCLSRKDGQYATKEECKKNCSKPQPPAQPPNEGGGGPNPNVNIKPTCDCSNLRVLDVSSQRISNQSDCLESSQYDEWVISQSVIWDCPDENTLLEITIAGGDEEAADLDPKVPVTIKGGQIQRFDKTYKIPCSDTETIRNLALNFRGQIVTPAGQIITCYPGSDPITVNLTPCCKPSDGTTSTTTSTTTPCPECPSDEPDSDNDETYPDLPESTTSSITPSPSGTSTTTSTTTPCPDCPSPVYNSSEFSVTIKGRYQATGITDEPLGSTVKKSVSATNSSSGSSSNGSTTTQSPSPTISTTPGPTISTTPGPIITTTEVPISTTANPATTTTTTLPP